MPEASNRLFGHKCWSVQAFEVPNLVHRCYAYAEFGEIQSGYDARAVDNTLASQGLEIYARATPESDFAKIVHPEGLGPRLIFDRIDRGVARASRITTG